MPNSIHIFGFHSIEAMLNSNPELILNVFVQNGRRDRRMQNLLTKLDIQNNNTLKTLEERQDDSPFIARINELDIERINLESFDPSPSGIDAMQLTKSGVSEQLPNKNRLIIALALIGGFVFSIILALLTNLFKEVETEPTTKTSR